MDWERGAICCGFSFENFQALFRIDPRIFLEKFLVFEKRKGDKVVDFFWLLKRLTHNRDDN
jgi:hypothetical protein